MKVSDLSTEVTTYRKLTLRSVFSFGKFTNRTVHDVTIICPTYISFVYFQIPTIDFTDEVLDSIHMDVLLRYDKRNIKLSGVEAKRRHYAFLNFIKSEKKDLKPYSAVIPKSKPILEIVAKNKERRAKFNSMNSAGKLAWKNQGH